MLLPQSAAYKTLRDRLDSVSALHMALARSGRGAPPAAAAAAKDAKEAAAFADSLVAQFDKVQKLHSVQVVYPEAGSKPV